MKYTAQCSIAIKKAKNNPQERKTIKKKNMMVH